MCRGTTQVKQVKDICFLGLINPPDLNAFHGCASAQSMGHEVGRGPKICKQRRSFSRPLVFKFSRLEPEIPQYFYYLSELSQDEKRKKKSNWIPRKIQFSESFKKTYIYRHFWTIYFQNCFQFLLLRLSFVKSVTCNLVYLILMATKMSKLQGRIEFKMQPCFVLKFLNLMTNSVCMSPKYSNV